MKHTTLRDVQSAFQPFAGALVRLFGSTLNKRFKIVMLIWYQTELLALTLQRSAIGASSIKEVT